LSYQVIARKYRPQTFADLTGQEHITRTLGHALENDRLHHAYLFSGVRGTGKTTTARILAKGLNCHRGVTSEPCLECPSCREIASGNSMDVLEIDAASNTGVDNVRDVIINNLAISPARDRFKVFVIDEVHMLSTSAFNALLKTLEEPPSHVIFIMATTELHKVPDTILSRCQQFEFRQIPTEKIYLRLREIANSEGVTIAESALREIARAGAGSLRDAQSAFDQVIAFSGNSITEEDVTSSLGLVSVATLARFTEAIAQQQTRELFDLVEEIYSRGYDARNFTRELMAYFRHLLFIKSGIEESGILGVTEVEIVRLKELAPLFSEADLVRGFQFLAATEKEIKDSPQPRFQLELGLVRLAQLRRLKPIEELLGRLEALEKRLDGAGGSDPRPNNPGRPSGNPVVPPPQAGASPSRSSSGSTLSGSGSTLSGSPASPPPPALPSLPTVQSAPKAPRIAPPSPPQTQSAVRSADETLSYSQVMPEMPEIPAFDSEPVDTPEFYDLTFSDETEPQGRTPRAGQSSRPSREAPSAPPVARIGAAPPAANGANGNEIESILHELKRINRGLILTALEGASLAYRDWTLIATFSSDDAFAKRLRESTVLFRSIGETLFGRPLRIEIRINGEVVTAANEKATERDRLHERAMQIPAVRQFIEMTRGEIVYVRELGS
jgi:DNA polymerase III subunit gamma/tau